MLRLWLELFNWDIKQKLIPETYKICGLLDTWASHHIKRIISKKTMMTQKNIFPRLFQNLLTSSAVLQSQDISIRFIEFFQCIFTGSLLH